MERALEVLHFGQKTCDRCLLLGEQIEATLVCGDALVERRNALGAAGLGCVDSASFAGPDLELPAQAAIVEGVESGASLDGGSEQTDTLHERLGGAPHELSAQDLAAPPPAHPQLLPSGPALTGLVGATGDGVVGEVVGETFELVEAGGFEGCLELAVAILDGLPAPATAARGPPRS